MAVFATPPSTDAVHRIGITLDQATSVVILDVDGVLYNSQRFESAAKIARELFPDVIGDRFNHYQLSIAHSHLFKQKVTSHLETLLLNVNKLGIVLSSDWRRGYSVDQLKEIFAKHHFSVFIVSKTPDKSDIEYQNSLPKDTQEYYQGAGRTSEIVYWLKKHPWITNFVIYDDCDIDGDLAKTFGDNFILVDSNKLLTRSDIDKGLKVFGIKV